MLSPIQSALRLVSGAGDIKITKDGNVLLHEMQIQHPTASLIARVATAQDDITGDGTTSVVVIISELLRQAELLITEGLHPRLVTEGFDLAREKCIEILDQCKVYVSPEMPEKDTLLAVAGTSLRTKVHPDLAALLTESTVDAVLAIRQPNEPLDLHRIEIMEMQHKTDMDTTLTAEERQNLVKSEREFIDKRVQCIIDLKRKVCDEAVGQGDTKPGFVLINQKGIDPISLDALAREGILGLRRAKRRNMERLALACGGYAVNSVNDLTPDCLGYAGLVYEYILGEEKFTFVEDCKDAQSVTLLIKGPNKHTITQIKDALKDGLRAIKNTLEDGCVVPGAGAFEIVAHRALKKYEETVKGRARLGVRAFADALLIIPKVLANNSGHDRQETIVRLLEEAALVEARKAPPKEMVGLDLATGEVIQPAQQGILDNYNVKKQMIGSAAVIATNLLLVDEIMRAGLSSLKG
ncbi:T-complex protein 1 subunit zeta [Sparganum proliferum]